jgi:puromycin-sensitive aminopeptidase
VPITVRHGDHVDTLLLDEPEARLTLADPSAVVVVNAGGHSFFRVAYDDALRARLAGDALRSLDTLERYNLVDDAWNAVIAGHLRATDLMTFLEGFAEEREYAVWQAIVISLRGLGRLLDDEAFARLQQRVARLVAPALTDLGDPAESESDLVGKLRGLLTGALAVLGNDAATQAQCRELYDRSEADPGSVDPELVAAATSVVAATGGEAEYERMLARFRSASTPQDQLRHLYALAEFDSAELIDRTCEFALSGEVKTQNAPFLLRTCIGNRRHGARAWTFVRKHWTDVNERFPSNTIIRMVDTVKTLNRPSDVADIQAFFSEHPIRQASKTLEQILERQRVNANLREREEDTLTAALA